MYSACGSKTVLTFEIIFSYEIKKDFIEIKEKPDVKLYYQEKSCAEYHFYFDRDIPDVDGGQHDL